MKMLTDLIAEMALMVKEHGDMPVLVQCAISRRPDGYTQTGHNVRDLRVDSVYQVEEPRPGDVGHVILRGVLDDERSELTIGGLRLDGREPVAVIGG
jgi:hypothetical protein